MPKFLFQKVQPSRSEVLQELATQDAEDTKLSDACDASTAAVSDLMQQQKRLETDPAAIDSTPDIEVESLPKRLHAARRAAAKATLALQSFRSTHGDARSRALRREKLDAEAEAEAQQATRLKYRSLVSEQLSHLERVAELQVELNDVRLSALTRWKLESTVGDIALPAGSELCPLVGLPFEGAVLPSIPTAPGSSIYGASKILAALFDKTLLPEGDPSIALADQARKLGFATGQCPYVTR